MKLHSVVLAIVIALFAFSGIVRAEDVSVEAVTASVKSIDVSPPARVVKRMELSVVTVGEQVLAGRKTSDVLENRNSYEKLIKEVFDRVLVGYSVHQVSITPGKTTGISIILSPSGDVVRDIKLEVDFGGIPPDMAALVQTDMGGIEEKINDMLIGMPVDSLDWAGGISKSMIREMLEDQLPEFRTNLEILPGKETVVKVSLIPAGPIIRDVKVTLRSQSIPNILLLEASEAAQDTAAVIRGLPEGFVERHSDYFNELFTAEVVKRPVVRNLGLKVSSQINIGKDTEVVIFAETDKYRLTLEGYLDVGRTVDNTSGKLHLGKVIGKRSELFVETTFIPGSVSWKFAPGWGHCIGEKTEVGGKYEFSGGEGYGILWMNQELGRRWTLRLEHTPSRSYDELGIRYKLHDFLSAEYVFTSHDKWLRLVGNL